MRVAFLGTGDFGVPAIRALLTHGHALTSVVSQPDRPSGRGRDVRPTPVHALADELALRHIQAEDVNTPPIAPELRAAELGIVAAFGQKLGPQILTAFPHGCINIHGSLLPRYRGAAPYQRAMLAGDRETGVTIFQLNERWDAGAIWGQRATPIRDDETADELHDRLAELGAALLIDVLNDFAAGRTAPTPQDPALATRAPKLTKADGQVDWTMPAQRVLRRIHGLWSWPAAAAMFASRRGRQERVLLARVAVADDAALPTADLPPGAFAPDRTVQTGAGRLRLLELQPAGGKRMPFEAFANGRQIAPPDRFLPVPQ
jgi:methionyl-tRNA formyltransferase